MKLGFLTKRVIDKIIEEFPYLEFREYDNTLSNFLKNTIKVDKVEILKEEFRDKSIKEIYDTIADVFFEIDYDKISGIQLKRIKPYFTILDMTGEDLRMQLVLKYGVVSTNNSDLLVAKTFCEEEDSKIYKSLAFFKYPYQDVIKIEREFADKERRNYRIIDIRKYLRKQLEEIDVITNLEKKAFRNEVNKRCIEMINEEVDRLISEASEMDK
jgi:hypothetical protein